MILLWGLAEDPPMLAVATELGRRRAETITIDQALTDLVDVVGPNVRLWDRDVSLAEVDAMYVRPYDVRAIPGLDQDPQTTARIAAVEQRLLVLAEQLPGVVLNRPSCAHLNNSKPAQLRRIAKLAPGFKRPATCVTTTAQELSDFVEHHGVCVVKSVSGHRSQVRSLRISDLTPDDLDRVQCCPVQVQERVSGCDVRVHVIGERSFAAAIESSADDYRYGPASVTPTIVPEWVARQCVDLVIGLGLHIGGVDLRVTSEGEWFVFEVNPSPAFTYYEARTGQPIASAIADLLCAASKY